jgi:xanthine/CO dehydrogenase XdhC/CoxF family maturation factor
MAKKTIYVSDFTSKPIDDAKQSATITVKYGDGRRGQLVADAHVDDPIVKEIAKVGRQQTRRDRRPKSEATS